MTFTSVVIHQWISPSNASAQRILNVDLRLYPYRIQIKHKLIPGDKFKRVIMCQWFHDKTELNLDFLDDIWLIDEAYFLLFGHVNSKNSIFRGTAARNEILLRPLHSKKYIGSHVKTWHHLIILV